MREEFWQKAGRRQRGITAYVLTGPLHYGYLGFVSNARRRPASRVMSARRMMSGQIGKQAKQLTVRAADDVREEIAIACKQSPPDCEREHGRRIFFLISSSGSRRAGGAGYS